MLSENFRNFPVSSNVEAGPTGLTDPQLAAASLLAMGKSYARVAEELSVDVRTIYNWRKLPAFRRELRARREAIWCEASDRFRVALTKSMDVLDSFLNARYDMHRFRAATAILRHSGMRDGIDPTRRSSRKRPK